MRHNSEKTMHLISLIMFRELTCACEYIYIYLYIYIVISIYLNVYIYISFTHEVCCYNHPGEENIYIHRNVIKGEYL